MYFPRQPTLPMLSGDGGPVAARRPASRRRSGRALVEQLIPLAQRHEEVVLRGFAADEVDVLKKNLVTVYRNLDVLDREISEEPIATVRKGSAAGRRGTPLKANEYKNSRPRQPR
jgi:hypothetical protein